jgi:hypothetical protein
MQEVLVKIKWSLLAASFGVVGWLLRAQAVPASEQQFSSEAGIAPPAPTTGSAAGSTCRPIVWVRTRDGDAESSAPAALDWCARQLEEVYEREARTRQPWPDDGRAQEQPEGWEAAVRQGLETCDLPLALDVVECTEYPCVAALSPKDGTLTEGDKLVELVGSCQPLREVFGDSADLQLHEVVRDCDGRTGYVLQALAEHGRAWEAIRSERDGVVMRWMFRRYEDLQLAWACSEPEAEDETALGPPIHVDGVDLDLELELDPG